MFRRWRQHKHSRTIAGLTLGSTGLAAAHMLWPEGGNTFDIATIPSGVVLGLGLQGVIDMFFCEVAKPEDPPLL